MQKTMNFNNVAIASVKRSDYRIQFWYMSKDDAANIMKKYDLNEKSGLLYIFLLYKYKKNEYLLSIKTKRNYSIKPKNTMKIIKKSCDSKQKINIENYLTNKNIKKRIWKKWKSKYV